jgi:hypothetical protein
MTERTIGELNEQASVRRFHMDDVTFTFVSDGAMSMDPKMFLKTIPPAYWDEHPDNLDRHGQVAMSAGGLLVERDSQRRSLMPGWGGASNQPLMARSIAVRS